MNLRTMEQRPARCSAHCDGNRCILNDQHNGCHQIIVNGVTITYSRCDDIGLPNVTAQDIKSTRGRIA